MDTVLDAPAYITIVRDKDMVDMAMSVEYMCNGVVVGKLKNGQSITVTTQNAENYVVAKKPKGFLHMRNLPGGDPVLVTCTSGGHVEVHFVSGEFKEMNGLPS